MGVKFSELPTYSISRPDRSGDYSALLHQENDGTYKLYKSSINHSLRYDNLAITSQSEYYGFGDSTHYGHVRVMDGTDYINNKSDEYSAFLHSTGTGLMWSMCAVGSIEELNGISSATSSHAAGSYFYVRTPIDPTQTGSITGLKIARAVTNINAGDHLQLNGNVEIIPLVERLQLMNTNLSSQISGLDTRLTNLENSGVGSWTLYTGFTRNTNFVQGGGVFVYVSNKLCILDINGWEARYAFNITGYRVELLSGLPQPYYVGSADNSLPYGVFVSDQAFDFIGLKQDVLHGIATMSSDGRLILGPMYEGLNTTTPVSRFPDQKPFYLKIVYPIA